MKNVTRILALLLATLLCAALLSACGNTSVNTPSTTASAAETKAPQTPDESEATIEDTTPEFPEANYNGEAFTVYERVDSTYSAEGQIYAEEENGDLMNDQTLKRNTMLESKYKVKVAVMDNSSPASKIKTDIGAGNVTYDAVIDRRSTVAGLATSGNLYDFHDLGVDLTTPWWDANCAEGYDINGKLFFAVNDISYANLSGARFLYFNKAMIDDFKLSDPYKLVEENQWILDNFVTMVKGVSDIAADGSMGKYGLLMETGASNGNHMHLMTGSGVRLVKWVDGELQSNVDDTLMNKLQDITDKLKSAFGDPNYVLSYADAFKLDTTGFSSSQWDTGRANFAAGHFLFVQNGMGVASQFAEMADGYGVVPNPKYDSNQDRYYHKVDRYSLIWCIPNDKSIDMERVANVMDYWAYIASTTTMPAYYDITIKTRRVNDPVASQNIDIVKNTITFELADLFSFNITDAVNQGYEGGAITTKMNQYKTAIKTAIQKFNKDLKG